MNPPFKPKRSYLKIAPYEPWVMSETHETSFFEFKKNLNRNKAIIQCQEPKIFNENVDVLFGFFNFIE